MPVGSVSVPTLLVIAGPTAVGKTALCARLARQLGTVVVSADSRQCYAEMSIGTAKPTPAEMDGVPHYFIGSHSITHPLNAGRYERECLALLNELFQKYPVVILSGGTGLYIQAVCEGLDDLPPVSAALRQHIQQRLQTEGIEKLVAELTILDPMYTQTADLQNPARVTRALEICLSSGQPYSSFRGQKKANRPFRTVKIALTRPRPDLYARIEARIEAMLQAGLVDEAAVLLPYRNELALQTVGYQEVFPYLDGTYSYDEMVQLLKRNTRRYAKRQLTWFRNQSAYTWFSPDEYDSLWQWLKTQTPGL